MDRLLKTLILLVLVVIAMIYGAFILKPILLAMLLAIWFNPIVSRIEDKFKSRSLGYIISVIMLMSIVGATSFLIGGQLTQLFDRIESGALGTEDITGTVEEYAGEIGISSSMADNAIELAVNYSGKLLTAIFEVVLTGSGDILLTGSLGLVLGFFIAVYGPSVQQLTLEYLNESERKRFKAFMSQSASVCYDYLKGISIVMLVLAVIMSIIYLIIGVEYAIIWGILTGLLAFIPYLGSLLAVILPFSFSLMSTNTLEQPAQILIAFMIVQQIEGNLLTPKVIGKAVRINPLIAIVFLIICGKIWGVFGVFISLMLAGVIKVAVDVYGADELYSQLMGDSIES